MNTNSYRSRAELLIAVDDTDCPEQGGTGRVARETADRLADRFPAWGVTRHQLAVLPEINYTARNSANVVHLLQGPGDLDTLAAQVASWVAEMAQEGSAPGLCVAASDALLDCDLGQQAQRRVVSKNEVWQQARARAVHLQPLLESDGGIIGAFCAACLAAGGNDGRFVHTGRMRALSGEITVAQLLAAGADLVLTDRGEDLREGTVMADRLRPAMVGGKCVVYVRHIGDGRFSPIKGRPDDPQPEVDS